MALVINGAEASIWWGYQKAAIVRAFVIARDPESRAWQLSGEVEVLDDYAMTQAVRVQVRHTGGAWRWPVVSWYVEGASSIRAVLGPKE